MNEVISTESKPIKSWVTGLEDVALEQAKNLANLPFLFRHVALMPDAHFGYGMPIGGVIALKGVVIPNAVGVDIGCGMCAVPTSITEMSIPEVKKVLGDVRSCVPVGFNHHKTNQDESLMPSGSLGTVCDSEYGSALKQIGTLGGGNHFIELQKGGDGSVWVMIHSGSRNLGYKVAKHYNEIAIALNEKWKSGVDKKWELAFLPLDSKEGQEYLTEMQYCVDFALANRKLMMERILDCLHSVVGGQHGEIINIAHNYARLENHFGENVVVHRKGATSARDGEIGIIPGSQGTRSYIVRGKGNQDSFQSCSHGAGRKMGRKQAQRELDLATEQKALDDLGIVHSVRNVSDLDESPGAYKSIDEVMENQVDLVDRLVELRPLGVVKG